MLIQDLVMIKQQMHHALNNIELEMRRLDLWSACPPAMSAFESEIPFFLDTMALHEWMQWVFVARFRALLEGNLPLPPSCNVAPVLGEYCCVNVVSGENWVAWVEHFDQLVSGA